MKKNLFIMLIVMLFSMFTIATTSKNAMAQEQEPANPDQQSENIHPIPQIPIIVDGVKLAPDEITKFNGQPLYYFVDDQAKVLRIFTTLEGISGHAQQASAKNNMTNSNMLMLSCYDLTVFYQNWYLSGTPYFVQSGTPGTSFTGVYSFLNNDVESLKTTTCNVYTKLFDNTNFTGSQLWLSCCGTTNNLGIYGWNNRAGSIRVD